MERDILFIGILERDIDRDILKVIKQLLKLSEFRLIYEHLDETIIGFCKSDQIFIIVDILEGDLYQEKIANLDFDILIHNLAENKSNLVKEILSRSKVWVLNTDNDDLISLVEGLDSRLTITYGFNGKATLTISSYDVDPTIKISICLQRDITSLKGIKTEPFEFCIAMETTDESKIYPLLAGVALNILMGDTILNKSQEDYILLTV